MTATDESTLETATKSPLDRDRYSATDEQRERFGYGAYRRELAESRIAVAARSSIIMGVTIQNLFLVLDYYAFPELFSSFLATRMIINLGFVICYLVANTYPRLAMIGALYTLGIGMLALIFGGGETTIPYYVGLILVFFGMGVMLPLSAKQAAAVAGSMAAIFALTPILAGADLSSSYGLQTFFVAAAAVESVFCCSFLDRMRFTDFRQRQQLVAAEEHLREMDRVKSRFTANVHHELRTPLTLTLAPLEGLLSGDFGRVPEELLVVLRTMHANGLRLLKLINNLLDLAKIEGAQLRVHRLETDVAQLVENLLDGARPLANRKSVELISCHPGTLPRVNVDPDAFDKILINLVGNALKFTESGGLIEVSIDSIGLEHSGPGIRVSVRDTGVGIPEDQICRIFDRFAQVDGSSTRRHEGTGIGLALVKELVELHGGHVWAASAGLGFGTVVSFEIPIGEPDATEEEELLVSEARVDRTRQSIIGMGTDIGLSDEAEFSESGSHDFSELERHVARTADDDDNAMDGQDVPADAPEVLIVEDNPDMRRLLRFLVSKDFRTRVARNGREGLEAIQDRHPDLVLTDVMMPEMNGTELCRRIKANPSSAGIPVILVTSKADREMQIEGLELGADDYITKPFHPRELMARVRGLVRLHGLQSELASRNSQLEDSNSLLARTNRDLEVAMCELREAEVHLADYERRAAVGELAAGVAHEINNPVNFALNALRTLKERVKDVRTFAQEVGELDDSIGGVDLTRLRSLRDDLAIAEVADDLIELVEITDTGLTRTHRLVGSLRDFASPSSGDATDVDVKSGLDSTLQLVSSGIPSNVDVRLEFSDERAITHADPWALNQVFLNLIKNSAEALKGNGGTISISVTVDREVIQIQVRDDGPGMSADTLEQLFDPFFTTKESGGGSGLGLSISRRIVENFGGRLIAESSEGQGALFTINLPRSQSPELPAEMT